MAAYAKALDALGIPYVRRVLSAHRTPAEADEVFAGAEAAGVRVIIADPVGSAPSRSTGSFPGKWPFGGPPTCTVPGKWPFGTPPTCTVPGKWPFGTPPTCTVPAPRFLPILDPSSEPYRNGTIRLPIDRDTGPNRDVSLYAQIGLPGGEFGGYEMRVEEIIPAFPCIPVGA